MDEMTQVLYRTEDAQILHAPSYKLVSRAFLHQGFVHPRPNYYGLKAFTTCLHFMYIIIIIIIIIIIYLCCSQLKLMLFPA
jgi:hypothetical protein